MTAVRQAGSFVLSIRFVGIKALDLYLPSVG